MTESSHVVQHFLDYPTSVPYSNPGTQYIPSMLLVTTNENLSFKIKVLSYYVQWFECSKVYQASRTTRLNITSKCIHTKHYTPSNENGEQKQSAMRILIFNGSSKKYQIEVTFIVIPTCKCFFSVFPLLYSILA